MENKLFLRIFHIFFVGSLFLYIGIVQKKMPYFLYNIILFLAVFIFFFHLYKAFVKFALGYTIWVNLFHILVITPLLFIIGIYRKKTPRYIFEFILMLSFSAIGYHGYYLFNN
jgi:hypothetical protein